MPGSIVQVSDFSVTNEGSHRAYAKG